MVICLRLYRVESLTDDLTGIRDQQEGIGRILLNIVPEAYRFYSVQYREDDIFVFTAECTFGQNDGGASVQVFLDIRAYRLRIAAYNVKVFGQIQTLDESVDHEGAKRKTKEGIQSGLNVEYEASGKCNEEVCDQQGVADVEAGIFPHDHGDHVGTAA